MIDQFSVTIPELSGKRKKRRVYVYIPDSFQDNPELRYPVLYMFDGHNVFFDSDATYGKSWGMKEYMDCTETQMMIVAVECSHAPNNGRLKEYAPFSFRDDSFGYIQGKGSITMNWFIQTLKPRIDEEYPTLPDRETTYIAGSSMGGLMSLYAVSAYPQVFSKAACLSPSLWTAPDKMLRLIRNADYPSDTVIYMDYGSRQMGNHESIREVFTQTAGALAAKGTLLTTRIIPNGDHCEACWEEQIPFFMNTLTYERE